MNHTSIKRLPVVDDVIDAQEASIGVNLTGYRNNVHRVINHSFASGKLSSEEERKLIITGCFHDIGIWSAATFDYLDPSIEAALDHLRKTGRAEWSGTWHR